jgi:XapX domain-containing protein
MKPYLISLAAGLLVGVIYGLLGVRSPAPPAIALIGLLGILLGEQVVPIAKRVAQGHSVAAFLSDGGRAHVLGRLPANDPQKEA